MKRLMATAMVATAVVVAGCANHEHEDAGAQAEAARVSMLEVFYTEMQSLEAEQGVEVVVTRLLARLSLPEYAEIRPAVFEYLLHVLLRADHLEEAQTLYMEVAATDAELAAAGFAAVMSASLSGDDADAQVVWLERVLAAPLPPTQRAAAWQSRMNAYAQAGSVSTAAARVAEIMESDLAVHAPVIFSTAITRGLQINDHDGVESLLAAMGVFKGRDEAVDRLLLTSAGDLLVARGLLDEALDYYLAHATRLGDAQLNRCLRPVLRTAQGKGLEALVRRGVDAIYARGAEFPATRDTMAAWFVGEAVNSGDSQRLLEATRQAFDSGASATRFYPVFMNGYYAAIQSDSAALRAGVVTLIKAMRETDDLPEHLLGSMGTALLDAAFFEDDFKGALAVVEAGIPGFDADWHVELKDKINAHIALQDERFDEAVELFNRHIKRVSAWEHPATNPEDGRPVIKEAVLGFNEKRIGDIWSGVEGRAADAVAAYARARGHYEAALEILDAGTPEYDRAAAELAGIPKDE